MRGFTFTYSPKVSRQANPWQSETLLYFGEGAGNISGYGYMDAGMQWRVRQKKSLFDPKRLTIAGYFINSLPYSVRADRC